jgi:hypothetical protein
MRVGPGTARIGGRAMFLFIKLERGRAATQAPLKAWTRSGILAVFLLAQAGRPGTCCVRTPFRGPRAAVTAAFIKRTLNQARRRSNWSINAICSTRILRSTGIEFTIDF